MGIWRVKNDDLGPFCDGDMLFDYPMAESVPQMESLGMFTNSCKRTVHSSKIRSMVINKNHGVSLTQQDTLNALYMYMYATIIHVAPNFRGLLFS